MNISKATRAIVRPFARTLTIALLGLVGAFLIGEGPGAMQGFFGTELLQLVQSTAFVAMLVALAIAWIRPKAGGAATLAAWVAFYGAEYAASGQWPSGWIFPLFAITGGLWLLLGLLGPSHPRGSKRTPPESSTPKTPRARPERKLST